eukprot:7644739-Pyramimonas_sp.AAC.1
MWTARGSFLAGFVPVLAEEIEFCLEFLFPGEEEGAEGAAAAEALLAGIKQDFTRLGEWAAHVDQLLCVPMLIDVEVRTESGV